VVAIAGNTARVLKSTYDTSKLIKIIGTASAVAGAAAFTVTAFDKVPSLTDIAIKLGAIIAMKVLIDDADSDDINPNSPSGAFTTASQTTKINKIASYYGVPAKDVKEAIHRIKAYGAWRGDGANKNPDVVVDLESGEVYVKKPDGTASDDSIGNIRDELDR
ncbi:hypothetical protein ABZ293_32160, partial [Nocardia sp. NPDC005998]